jgi:hypothetical protein
MKFEEQFPSLNAQNPNALMYSKILINETCIDKQKVREAIEYLRKLYFDGKIEDVHEALIILHTGLGL